jgi:hypothetical protein
MSQPCRTVPIGTRVRLTVPGLSGWQGTGTMLCDNRAIKDGCSDPDPVGVGALFEEWEVLADQTPNPAHVAAVCRAFDRARRG